MNLKCLKRSKVWLRKEQLDRFNQTPIFQQKHQLFHSILISTIHIHYTLTADGCYRVLMLTVQLLVIALQGICTIKPAMSNFKCQ